MAFKKVGMGTYGKREQDRMLGQYLKEIGETSLITREKEAELAKRVRAGDQSALEELTKSNLRFVVSIAKQYQNQGLSLSDLISEGNMGLIKAAQRFDETRGFKFISYAVWWIRQSILQALADQSRIIRLPLNRVGTLHKLGKVRDRFSQKYGRLPSNEELAQGMDMTEREVNDALRINNTHISLDSPLGTEHDSNTLKDILVDDAQNKPDTRLVYQSLKGEIKKALCSLSEREMEVLTLYFGIERDHPLTLEEIGARFHLTRERVRQIKEKALKRLRRTARNRNLWAFLT